MSCWITVLALLIVLESGKTPPLSNIYDQKGRNVAECFSCYTENARVQKYVCLRCKCKTWQSFCQERSMFTHNKYVLSPNPSAMVDTQPSKHKSSLHTVLKPLTNAHNHGRSLGYAHPRSSMTQAAHSRAPHANAHAHAHTLFSVRARGTRLTYWLVLQGLLKITRLQSCAQSQFCKSRQYIGPQLMSYAF